MSTSTTMTANARDIADQLAELEQAAMSTALAELEHAAEAIRHARQLLEAHDDAAGRIIYGRLPEGVELDELHERFDQRSGSRRLQQLMLELAVVANVDRRLSD